MTQNPFAAPSTEAYVSPTAPTEARGVWREGDVIVMERGALLPDFCVKTGEPAAQRLKRNLQWHHPAAYLAILFNVIIYVIVAMIVRKTAQVEIPVSEAVLANRKKWILIGWGCGLGGFVLMIVGFAAELPVVGLLFLCVMLFGIFGGLFGARLLWPSKIDDHYVRLKGAKEPFLARLPAGRP